MIRDQDIDMSLVSLDLFTEIKLLTDLDPNLHKQLKALEDDYKLYFGYESLRSGGNKNDN